MSWRGTNIGRVQNVCSWYYQLVHAEVDRIKSPNHAKNGRRTKLMNYCAEAKDWSWRNACVRGSVLWEIFIWHFPFGIVIEKMGGISSIRTGGKKRRKAVWETEERQLRGITNGIRLLIPRPVNASVCSLTCSLNYNYHGFQRLFLEFADSVRTQWQADWYRLAYQCGDHCLLMLLIEWVRRTAAQILFTEYYLLNAY